MQRCSPAGSSSISAGISNTLQLSDCHAGDVGLLIVGCGAGDAQRSVGHFWM